MNLVFSIFQYIPLVHNGPLNSAARSSDIGQFLATVVNWGLGLAISLTVLSIIFGGIQYMTTDALFKKEQGKERIKASVVGLLIALSGWIILNQIDPRILQEKNLALESIKGNRPAPVVIDNGVDLEESYYFEDGIQVNRPSEVTGDTVIDEVLALAKEGKTFDNDDWNKYALQQIMNSKLLQLNPKDKDNFFPNGITPQAYLNLMASMAYKESGHQPDKTTPETFKNGKGEYVISTGLFQLSYESVGGYGHKDMTTDSLKDPYKNIEIAVDILEKRIEKDGYISHIKGYTSKGKPIYEGAAAYWAVLR